MKLEFVAVFLALSTFEFTSAAVKCHAVEVGVCLDHVVNFVNSFPRRTLPKTESEIRDLCKALETGTSCLDDFIRRCMTPLQREMERLLMEGTRDYHKRYCAPGSELPKNYLKNAECLNEVIQTDEASIAINRGIAMFEKIEDVSMTDLFAYMCCGWNAIFDTFMDMAEERCGSEASDALHDILEAAVSNFPNMMCETFDPASDKCDAVLPPKGTKPTGRQNPFANAFRYFFANHIE